MTTTPQAHLDHPTGPALFEADGSAHTEAVATLLAGTNPDWVVVSRAKLAAYETVVSWLADRDSEPSEAYDDDPDVVEAWNLVG